MPATRFSELIERNGYQVTVDDLRDQLKHHKHVLKATGFAPSQLKTRKECVLQLQVRGHRHVRSQLGQREVTTVSYS